MARRGPHDLDGAAFVFGTRRASTHDVVHPLFRLLLWTAAILAPGGLILLPVLAGDALLRKAPPPAPGR